MPIGAINHVATCGICSLGRYERAEPDTVDNDSSTGWSPTGSDSSAWWQVDLGQTHQLGQFSLTTRQDKDQSETRGKFEIRASNDPSFGTCTVLGRQTDTLLGIPVGGRSLRHVRRAIRVNPSAPGPVRGRAAGRVP
ncbi:discoidin domain-containing protein [Streptomyces sp. NPDC002764]|uniref:discoidin domain-containing protein n=1 Tax=Streptomyces sp. NPDC002764 TaxID=3154428 RepID=UPI0033248B43